ncbi:hypothetical protein FSP39_009503 [Pinctada imbricata]|uniref:PIH1D1/2/3 CS-like domain-containing protein n=1 Tax=Pinctada imbricata TaxID=66713 RepID=A0AA88YI06_PINIB|nr:hypothetical protein FSP39_009503 [Pinctada imbricata]
MNSSVLADSYKLSPARGDRDHRGEERLISVVLNKETFESFEDKFVCPNSLLEISLSGDEKGPWSKLDDDVLSDLYKAPMGVLFKTFPQTKYIRLQCIPINEDCQQDSTNNAITTGSTPRNAFQVLMDASKSTTNHTVPRKKRSRYEILFKQSVTSEDMFLQMGNKTPATSSCEDMVVKVMLPGTRAADMTVDVKKKFLDLRTPKYKLGLHLPHPVDDKSGKAQWDNKKETLSVTLRMMREYDLFNF